MKKETIDSLIKSLTDFFNNADEDTIFEVKNTDNTAVVKLRKDGFYIRTTLQVSYRDKVRSNCLTVNEDSIMSIEGEYTDGYKVIVPIVDNLEITDDQADMLLSAIERLKSLYEKKLEKEAVEERDRIVLEFIERING